MKRNSNKGICKENEIMEFYSLYFDLLNFYFDLLNSNRRRLVISDWENLSLHEISLFKATCFYFTKVVTIPFVN